MTDAKPSTPTAAATTADLEGAVKAVRSGLPVREAARRFAVPRSTLAGRVARSSPDGESHLPAAGYPLATVRAELVDLERVLARLDTCPAPQGITAELLGEILRNKLADSYLLTILRRPDGGVPR